MSAARRAGGALAYVLRELRLLPIFRLFSCHPQGIHSCRWFGEDAETARQACWDLSGFLRCLDIRVATPKQTAAVVSHAICPLVSRHSLGSTRVLRLSCSINKGLLSKVDGAAERCCLVHTLLVLLVGHRIRNKSCACLRQTLDTT